MRFLGSVLSARCQRLSSPEASVSAPAAPDRTPDRQDGRALSPRRGIHPRPPGHIASLIFFPDPVLRLTKVFARGLAAGGGVRRNPHGAVVRGTGPSKTAVYRQIVQLYLIICNRMINMIYNAI